MDEEHVLDQIPAYALGCLEANEIRWVESHLAKCLSCQKELASYQTVITGLALSPSQIKPPERLRDSILKAAGSEVTAPGRQASRKPLFFRLRHGRPGWVPIWGIASLVLILILITTNLLLWRQVNNISQRGTIQYSDFQIVQMTGTPADPKATGIIVISQDGWAGSLNVDGLQPLDPARQYQLWLTDHGTRTSGGIFSVDQAGYGTLKITITRPLIDYNSFGITIEPAGGSPGPTGTKVLGGNM